MKPGLDGYEVTYDDSDTVSHYTLKLGTESLAVLRREYDEVRAANLTQLRRPDRLRTLTPWRVSRTGDTRRPDLAARVREIVDSLDSRGAWVQEGNVGLANRVVGLTTGKPMVVVVGEQVIPIAKEQAISIYEGSESPMQAVISSGLFAANIELLCEYLITLNRRGQSTRFESLTK